MHAGSVQIALQSLKSWGFFLFLTSGVNPVEFTNVAAPVTSQLPALVTWNYNDASVVLLQPHVTYLFHCSVNMDT